jgi:hypothetical protein
MSREELIRRIESLKTIITWNRALLEGLPQGTDPKAEAFLAQDVADLAAARTELARIDAVAA